ncbi:Retroviral aspartyl protease [compost metagenome]
MSDLKHTLACVALPFAVALAAAGPALAEPLIITETGHPVIHMTANDGDRYAMVVDTAASTTALFPRMRERLGLHEPNQTVTVQGASGGVEVGVYQLRSLKSDTVSATALNAVGLDTIKNLEAMDGILGVDVLRSGRVEFDSCNNRLQMLTAAWAPDQAWRTVAMSPIGPLYTLEVTLNGAPVTAVLDTGARRTIVNRAAMRAAGVADNDPRLVAGVPVRGASRTSTQSEMLDFDSFLIGDLPREAKGLTVSDLPVFAALGLTDKPAMILGFDRLRDLRFVADFPGHRLLILGDGSPGANACTTGVQKPAA